MNATSRVYQARCRIWSNLPGAQANFSACKRGCGRQEARDGGICLKCAVEDLAKIIGEDDALAYVKAVNMVRELEDEQDSTFGE